MLFFRAVAASTFNGISFSTKNGIYTSDVCTISDTEFQKVNATSAVDCSLKCANATQTLPGGGFNCTSYAYSANNCRLYDRSINLLSVFSSTGNSCGGQSLVGATSGVYQGTRFTATGDLYSLTSCRTNQLYIAGPQVQSFDESCTAFSVGNLSTLFIGCFMYDKPLNQLSFNTASDVKGWNCGFLLSRTTQCSNSGNNITCEDALDPPAGTTTSTSAVSTSDAKPIAVYLVPAAAVVFLVVVVVFAFKRKRNSTLIISSKSTPIASYASTIIAETPITKPQSTPMPVYTSMSLERKRVSQDIGELPINPRPYIPEDTFSQPPLLDGINGYRNVPLHVCLQQQPRTELETDVQPPLLVNKETV
ncbi:hypothetical protein HDV01_002093 [Terramyces sp. JEL0728]|nr:hypothetical protein HDV01_002093 [Terramyces sp. JEL0728]